MGGPGSGRKPTGGAGKGKSTPVGTHFNKSTAHQHKQKILRQWKMSGKTGTVTVKPTKVLGKSAFGVYVKR